MNYIIIYTNEDIDTICIIEDNRLVEYYIEKRENEKLLGNIYRGRVENVLKGMDAAFVNIGEGKNGYLHLRDVLDKEQIISKEKYKIDKIIKSGEEVIVQVIKEAIGTKGPKLSAHISIPGRYLVLTPYYLGINISRKIKDNNEIKRLKIIGNSFSQDNIGIIFRTASNGIDESLLREEYKYLLNIFNKIESQRNFLPTPKLIYKEPSLAYKIARDYLDKADYKIFTNNKDIYDQLLELEDNLNQNIKHRIKFNKDISTEYNKTIQDGIKVGLQRKVDLNSGGYIVIDETEALTAIDVNTGKYTGSLSLSETIYNINMEASEEIARQIRLRNIGGIIIIDFIDMKNDEHIQKVLYKLSSCFESDKNKPRIIDITKLGLVEVSRKKLSPTLKSQTTNNCPVCHGSGRVIK